MRRWNPGRPCCRVCPEDCYIPAYRIPPSTKYGSYIERWDRFPVYSGVASAFGNVPFCYRPSSSGDITYFNYHYERALLLTPPTNFEPPPFYSKPVPSYGLNITNVSTLPLWKGINSFTGGCAVKQNSDFELYLTSIDGTDCGQRTFHYQADLTNKFINTSTCSGIQLSITPYARLELNIDEGVHAIGIIPSGGRVFNIPDGANGTNPPVTSGITNTPLTYYNNTVSTPNNPSKLWMTVVSSGIAYTGYFECGRDSGSGVVQTTYYRGIPAQFCYPVIDGMVVRTESYPTYYRTPQRYLCGDDKEKLSQSSTDSGINYDRPKGYWRYVDSWQGTINSIEVSGVRNIGDFNWSNVCPVLSPYDSVAGLGNFGSIQHSIGGLCTYNYVTGYQPELNPWNSTAFIDYSALVATVTLTGLTSWAAEFNGTHSVPIVSWNSGSSARCGPTFIFSVDKETGVLCTNASSRDVKGFLTITVTVSPDGRALIEVGVRLNHSADGPCITTYSMTYGELCSADSCYWGATCQSIIDGFTNPASIYPPARDSIVGAGWGSTSATMKTYYNYGSVILEPDGNIVTGIGCNDVQYILINPGGSFRMDAGVYRPQETNAFGMTNFGCGSYHLAIAGLNSLSYAHATLTGIG